MKNLIILVGNIGCGKSTLSKKLAKQGYSIVCRDAFRYMIGAGEYIFDIKREPAVKRAAEVTLESFLQRELNIVCDETNVSKAMRKPLIELGLKYKYNISVIELPRLTKRKAVNRRMKSPHGRFGKDVWENVWDRFNLIYEAPETNEGINRIKRINKC